MTTKEIAIKYGLDPYSLQTFLSEKQEKIMVRGILKNIVADEDVEEAVESYNQYKFEIDNAKQEAENEKQLIEKERILAETERKRKEEEKNQAIANILISSGFNFEGYRITKYSGYISGDDAVQIPRGGIFGKNHGQDLTNALVKIRIQALKELKEAAYDLGCNAVIGVDFDYITLEPETANITGGTLYEPYVICVTANGNAVIIEKE